MSGEERRLTGKPDVYVAEIDASGSAPRGGALTAARQLPTAVEIERDSFVEIRDALDFELVTVIELLSPSNKRPGPDREQYLAKRRSYLRANVNLVEVDLFCRWPRMPVEGLPDCAYCVIVSRVHERPRAGIWPVGLRDPLPIVPVPLRPGAAGRRARPEGDSRPGR